MNIMLDWLKRLFSASAVNGEAGRWRGYMNTAKFMRTNPLPQEQAIYWANADPPRDDYDRGVLDALSDFGVPDPGNPH